TDGGLDVASPHPHPAAVACQSGGLRRVARGCGRRGGPACVQSSCRTSFIPVLRGGVAPARGPPLPLLPPAPPGALPPPAAARGPAGARGARRAPPFLLFPPPSRDATSARIDSAANGFVSTGFFTLARNSSSSGVNTPPVTKTTRSRSPALATEIDWNTA